MGHRLDSTCVKPHLEAALVEARGGGADRAHRRVDAQLLPPACSVPGTLWANSHSYDAKVEENTEKEEEKEEEEEVVEEEEEGRRKRRRRRWCSGTNTR
jgi:hypothetical protein